jgi:hypothetical protein
MTETVHVPVSGVLVDDRAERARLVRRGYWSRWALGLGVCIGIFQACLALVFSIPDVALLPFAATDAFVTLVAAAVAILLGPGVLSPPNEARLRLETWAAAGRQPGESEEPL